MPSAGIGIIASSVVIAACTEVLMENFTSVADWSAGITSVAGGRTGNAGNIAGSSTANFTIAAPADQSPYATIGFAYKVSQVGAAIRNILSMRDTGTTRQNTLRVETDGKLSLYGGTGSPLYGQTAAGTIVAGTWYYLEVQTFIDAAGFATVRINNTPVITVTGTNTLPGGANPAVASILMLGAGTGQTCQLDDLYLTTGPGCSFKGDITIP